jgi:CRP-like cAMP-binding protein
MNGSLPRRASVPDLLDGIREEMSARMSQLRPLVDEYGRLDAALQALGGIQRAAPAPASPAEVRTKSRARKTAPAKPRKRAARGANREAVLRAARARPGATSAELAAVSGVERPSLSGLLARLVKSGELQTRALPTGRTGYAPGEVGADSSERAATPVPPR